MPWLPRRKGDEVVSGKWCRCHQIRDMLRDEDACGPPPSCPVHGYDYVKEEKTMKAILGEPVGQAIPPAPEPLEALLTAAKVFGFDAAEIQLTRYDGWKLTMSAHRSQPGGKFSIETLNAAGSTYAEMVVEGVKALKLANKSEFDRSSEVAAALHLLEPL